MFSEKIFLIGRWNDIPEEPQVDPMEFYGIIERDFLKKVRRF
jgi:hypothetical protein